MVVDAWRTVVGLFVYVFATTHGLRLLTNGNEYAGRRTSYKLYADAAERDAAIPYTPNNL